MHKLLYALDKSGKCDQLWNLEFPSPIIKMYGKFNNDFLKLLRNNKYQLRVDHG